MDSEVNFLFEPSISCPKACRVVELLLQKDGSKQLASILKQGKVQASQTEELCRSSSFNKLPVCNCEGESCLLPEDDWCWQHPFEYTNAKIFGKHAFFHPNFAFGTAAVRGERALTSTTIAYWEIQSVEIFFGTSVMFGVGTMDSPLSSGYRFVDLIGFDENSYGLSHQGMAFHGGYSFRCCDPISQIGRGQTVGVLFNGPERKMSFFFDGQYVGTPFTNINTSKTLYPMLSSTAQQTEFILRRQIRWGNPPSLFKLSLQKVHEECQDFNSLSLPRPLLHELYKLGAKNTPPPKQSIFLNAIPPYNPFGPQVVAFDLNPLYVRLSSFAFQRSDLVSPGQFDCKQQLPRLTHSTDLMSRVLFSSLFLLYGVCPHSVPVKKDISSLEQVTHWEDESEMRSRLANITEEKFSHDYHNWKGVPLPRRKRDGGIISGPVATAVVTGMIGMTAKTVTELTNFMPQNSQGGCSWFGTAPLCNFPCPSEYDVIRHHNGRCSNWWLSTFCTPDDSFGKPCSTVLGDYFIKRFCCKSDPSECSWSGRWMGANTAYNYYCRYDNIGSCGSIDCSTNHYTFKATNSSLITGDRCDRLELFGLKGKATCGYIAWYKETDNGLEIVNSWYKTK